MPKISVILPNYNHGKFLTRRIESILNQTFQDFELIILDDASIDNSKQIIESYRQNPKISSILPNTENSGSTFIQWQKGLELAKGELIWIAESDDIAEPEFLDYHLKQFEKTTNLAVSFCASAWIDSNDTVIHEPNHEYEFTKSGQYLFQSEFAKGNLIYNASTAVFKKSLVENEILSKIKDFKYCGDWLFWISICQKGLVHRTSKRLNKFRRHDGNVSFKSETAGLQFSEGFMVLDYLFENTTFKWIQKQKILAFWALKLNKSDLQNKKQYLSQLPISANFWYLISPFFVLLQKRSSVN